MNSKLIVIDRLESAGKTSKIVKVVDVLRQQGIHNMVFVRESGSKPMTKALRRLIKDGAGDKSVTVCAELLMFYAAQVQLVEGVIKPALDQGVWVVSNRHILSSQAYRGGGLSIDTSLLQTLKDEVLGDLRLDLTLYLDIPPALGLPRARTHSELDRIEVESLASVVPFERTRVCYQALEASDDDRIITIDASQLLAAVSATIRARLTQWLYAQAPSL